MDWKVGFSILLIWDIAMAAALGWCADRLVRRDRILDQKNDLLDSLNSRNETLAVELQAVQSKIGLTPATEKTHNADVIRARSSSEARKIFEREVGGKPDA